MICVNDPKCEQLCEDASFPCYPFRYKTHHANHPEIVALGPNAGGTFLSRASVARMR